MNEYFNINYTCEFNITNMVSFYKMHCRNESCTYNKSYLSYHLTTRAYLTPWKYFENSRQEIRNTFSFKPKFFIKAQEFLKDLRNYSENMSIVGIHVRRGDLLTDFYAVKGYTVAIMKYITRAMTF